MRKIFTLLIFLSAVLTIYSEYLDRQFVYIFKPLPLIFIIAAILIHSEKDRFYRLAILVGLIFSLIGDIFLINSQSYFVFGLASFLLAHLCYIAAFFKAGKENFKALSLIAYSIGLIIFLLIFGGIPDNLKIAVGFYAFAISTMLCAALNFWLTKKTPKALLALSGAFLFIISDSALAYNRFAHEFFLAKLIILATYFPAQWLIARSVKASSAETV